MRKKTELLKIFHSALPLSAVISTLLLYECDQLFTEPQEQNKPPTVIIDSGPTKPVPNSSTVTFIWHGVEEDDGRYLMPFTEDASYYPDPKEWALVFHAGVGTKIILVSYRLVQSSLLPLRMEQRFSI